MTLPKAFSLLDQVDCEHAEFERVDPVESLDCVRAWFGAVPQDGTTLTVFAQDGTGSLYCLFQKSGVALNDAPVVYLGSEGFVTPVATAPADFIDFVGSQLSLSAYEDEAELFDDIESEDDPEYKQKERARRDQVARTLESLLGRSLRDPDTILDAARSAVPDLRAWVEANNAHG